MNKVFGFAVLALWIASRFRRYAAKRVRWTGDVYWLGSDAVWVYNGDVMAMLGFTPPQTLYTAGEYRMPWETSL